MSATPPPTRASRPPAGRFAKASLSPRARLFAAFGWLGLPLIGLPVIVAAQTAAPATADLDRVEVIGISPLPGQGVDRNVLPYSTQVIRRDRIGDAQTLNQLEFLSQNVTGMQVNDIQGSPFQGDLTYRGFRASPILGAGQGLSVYLDGVRINEPFGDVVNFDMIPEFAISSISLVPAANPAFGLNSLGGALAYTTLDGRSAPGPRAQIEGGSFGRKRVDLSYGHFDEASGWHQFVAATGFDEDGWRDDSDGKLGQFLGKIGRDDGTTNWSLALLLGKSNLVGNGLLPAYTIDGTELTKDLYFHDRDAVYTSPDKTKNSLQQLSFNAQHALDANTSLSALLYIRHSKRPTVNGDESDDGPPPLGEFNTTRTTQTGYGAGLSLARHSGAHQWQLGATVDASHVGYRSLQADGVLTADRVVHAIPGEESELSADVDGKGTSFGIYATDTWNVATRTHVTATARFNHTSVGNQLTSVDDDTGEVEDHSRERFHYSSVNPALGIAYKTSNDTSAPTVFANVARNTRVPTVIELGCADPDEPCRLPAGLQADPKLKQVKSTTGSIGIRWPIAPAAHLNIEAYRTDNRHDILFRSVDVISDTGYFANFPKTRNQGVDADLTFTVGHVDVGVGYSFLDATYRADGVLRQGERNVQIESGTRIAGLPRHTLKLAADWRAAFGLQGLRLGADLIAVTSRGTAGNEDGLLADPEDGEEEARRDVDIPGYAVVNLRAGYKPTRDWELYATIGNVFNRRYENYGALAATVFDAQGNFAADETDALFVAPGTPRSFLVGLRYRF